MTSTDHPLTEQQLAEIEARATAATPGPWKVCDDYADVLGPDGTKLADFWKTADGEFIARAPEDVAALLAEVRCLRDELAETKALNDPRLRGLLVKATPDEDLYVQWSTVCDMPGGVFSRETALEYGFPRSKVDHADKHGSSSRIGDGAWDDKGWVAEQRGWLRRDRIGDYAVEYLHGDREAAYALLEPFDEPAAPAVPVTGE